MITPNAELSIARQAKLLGVSRSSIYYRPKPDSTEELDLLKRLDEIFTEEQDLSLLVEGHDHRSAGPGVGHRHQLQYAQPA